MKPNPVVWFEIYVQDMPRAQAFYEAVFQCKLAPLGAPSADTHGMQMLAFPGDMTTMGAGGTLVKMAGVPSGGGGTLIYFACDDCAVEQARVEAAGGKVFRPKFSIGEYGQAALVTDTEGNMIGLHSMK
jgi:predicted enzyme related to lactoylglutathione lyase